MKKFLFSSFAFLVISFASNAADFILLNNNLFFEGKILDIKKEVIVFKSQSGIFDIPIVDVCEIFVENQSHSISGYKINDDEQSLCLKAKTDAASYHGKKVGHFCLGFLFGGFALIGTAFSNPTPYKGKETLLMSKNKASFDDPVYLDCYKKTAKRELLLAETAGWVSWIILLVALNG
jgi:hypothetical protein